MASDWNRRQILDAIEVDQGLAALYGFARETLDDDPGHDIHHVLRVAIWTLRLGGDTVDPREAIAAALLHDIVNLPKNSPDRAKASAMAADVARERLPAAGFDDAAISRIADAIETHSFSRGETPRSDLGRALCDADRLEAVGAIGLFRTISTGTRMGARYFDPADPWAADRELDDLTFSVDHFFTKLLGLHATFYTDAGRAEAARRTAYLRTTLEQLAEELGAPPPPI